METPYFMQIMHKNPAMQGGWLAQLSHAHSKTVTHLKRPATSEEGNLFKNEKYVLDVKRAR
jgi:hypothetical protein